MARPKKENLDYFPLDVATLHTLPLRRLRKQYGGRAGYAYICLLCEIYAKSYYLPIDESVIFDVADVVEATEEEILSYIGGMVKLHLFDVDLWERERVLTSKEIQARYFLAKSKAAYRNKDLKYLLVEPESESLAENISMEETPQIDAKTPQIEVETPQNPTLTTVKEMKGNEIEIDKINNIITTPSSSSSAREEKPGEIYPDHFRENCNRWRNELAIDEEWIASVVRTSGKGNAILGLLPDVMAHFESHIVSVGETGTMRTVNDYKRRFISWWRCMDFGTVDQILARKHAWKPQNGCVRVEKPKRSKIDEAIECARYAAENGLKLLHAGTYGNV